MPSSELLQPEQTTCAASYWLSRFAPIQLDDLKTSSELMDRWDNKYLLTTEQVCSLFQHCLTDFQVLEINQLRQFHYLSHYYDTPDFRTYLDHNQGRRRRIKIRHRNYVESGRHFFEVKLKGLRKITNKYRIAFDPSQLNAQGLNPQLVDYYRSTLAEHYGGDYGANWLSHLEPSISVGYYRATLVAKAGSGRITLDNGLYFFDDTTQTQLNKDRWIVEVKSATKRTAVDLWLASQGIRPTVACSKYGMGISLLKAPKRNTKFHVPLRKHFTSALK